MKRAKRKETIGNSRQYLMRSRKRDEEAADERDLVSSLPLDLQLQILVKLPPKCITKFISVSKHWSSIVRGKDLTELFISRSSTRSSFLITNGTPTSRGFHSCSQEEPSSGNSITIPNAIFRLSTPLRGLICGQEIGNSVSKVICNPSTGQVVTLPRFKTSGRYPYELPHFLGYDPVNDVYKVLCIMVRYRSHRLAVSEEHQVFTLGAREKAWRMTKCKHPHRPLTNEICRDGVVYYGASRCNSHEEDESLIVSFDVRSEDFGVIKLPQGVKIRHCGLTELVNYHGKIALVDLYKTTSNVKLWVLQDFKKQEWSKISVLLPDIARTWSSVFYCRGTVSTGEIVFAPSVLYNPFFLIYYDLKRNNARKVDIKGVRDSGYNGTITVFVDHVESPMFL